MSKLGSLKKIIGSMPSALVAYSGGVDSTFLLKIAKDVLGDNVLAVTAVSATYPKEELASSKKTASNLNARHKIIRTGELDSEKFVSNPKNRCYFCKKELFEKLRGIARQNRLDFVLDASNASDRMDVRPGSLAARELGVRSPLSEAGMTKQDIRRESRKLKLPTWDKPSLACLASRIPYGSRISIPVLSRINEGERYLKKIGFSQVRLRHYNDMCRIEVDDRQIPMLIKKRGAIVERLKRLGYNYVTMDMEGYRTGSMNLKDNTRRG